MWTSRQLLKNKGGVYMTTLCSCGNCSAVSHAAVIVRWFSNQDSVQVCPVCVLEHGQCFCCVYQKKKKKLVISCNCVVKVSTPCECMCVMSVRVMLHHVVTPRKVCFEWGRKLFTQGAISVCQCP